MFYEIYFLLIIFGAIFGSFANVCIYRLPKEQSISKKRSYCFHCKKKIQWFYNVPIFSYIFLKGRCANCNKKIPIQYLIVEIVSVFNFLIIYYFFGFTIETILLIFLFFLRLQVLSKPLPIRFLLVQYNLLQHKYPFYEKKNRKVLFASRHPFL